VGLVNIEPGKPTWNCLVESLNGRLRDDSFNTSWFRTLNDVRCTLATWREEYNHDRPQSGDETVSTPNQNRETPVMVRRFHPGLAQLQYPDDLLFTEPALLHASLPRLGYERTPALNGRVFGG